MAICFADDLLAGAQHLAVIATGDEFLRRGCAHGLTVGFPSARAPFFAT
jgi:hypothetical protein